MLILQSGIKLKSVGKVMLLLPMLLGAMWAVRAEAETAVTNRNTDLYEQAMLDAAKLASLASQTQLDLLQRNGAWAHVKTGQGQLGWVQMFHLRLGDQASTVPARGTGGNLVGNLLAGGRNTNTGTVGTGVKGLSKEDIQNAQANFTEFQKMQSFAADKQAADEYARAARLSARAVAEPDNRR